MYHALTQDSVQHCNRHHGQIQGFDAWWVGTAPSARHENRVRRWVHAALCRHCTWVTSTMCPSSVQDLQQPCKCIKWKQQHANSFDTTHNMQMHRGWNTQHATVQDGTQTCNCMGWYMQHKYAGLLCLDTVPQGLQVCSDVRAQAMSVS